MSNRRYTIFHYSVEIFKLKTFFLSVKNVEFRLTKTFTQSCHLYGIVPVRKKKLSKILTEHLDFFIQLDIVFQNIFSF